jgi:hypothetical protein
MSEPNSAAGGGAVYLEWIRDLTAAQDARKDKIEARGLAVISVSGALVALLFGLATLATRTSSDYRLPADARGWLYAALVLFTISALLAILTNLPFAYRDVASRGLLAAVSDEYWSDSEAEAQQRIAVTRVDALLWNRRVNALKAWVLAGAILFQIAAGLLNALAVYEVLRAAPVS